MDKFEYFIERTDKKLDSIESKLDTLFAFKWQIIGGSTILSLLVTVILNVYF